jgi:hypothetical protein
MAKKKDSTADAPAKPEKPKEIEIVSVKRTRHSIVIHWRQGNGDFKLDERDNPLPSFGVAIDALGSIVSTICHFPQSYIAGLRVSGFDLGSRGGATTIVIRAKKDLDDSSKEFGFVTPERLLEQPSEEGSYSPPLGVEAAALIAECIAEAKAYVKGDRAQGQIELPEGAEDDDAHGDCEDTAALKFDATGGK